MTFLRSLSFLFLCIGLLNGAETAFESLLRRSEKDSVIQVPDSELITMLSNPRDFSIFLSLVTADARSPAFKICKPISDQFQIAADQYQNSLGAQGRSSKKFQQKPLFFVKCETEKCRSLIEKAKWETIPKIVHLPSTKKSGFDTSVWKEMGITQDLDAGHIASFIGHQVGYQFEIEPPFSTKILPYITTLTGLFFAVQLVRRFRANRMFWFFIAMIVYMGAMAGLVFNSIHRPPFSYRHPQTGNTAYIYPQARMQFVVEGFIMAVLLSGCGLLWMIATVYIPRLKLVWQQRVAYIAWLALFYYVYTWIFTIFRTKYSWMP